MNFAVRKNITIEKVSGGYVIDWNDPRERDPMRDQMAGVWPSKVDPPTSGREIITDAKKLAKRVNDFFGVSK